MKKFNTMLLTAVMVSSLTACGSVSNNSSTAGNAVDEIVSSNSESEVFDNEASGNEASESESSDRSSEAEKPETITVTCLNGAGETVQVEVPYDPQRIAVVDMAMLDIIDNLGLGDRVVGSSTTALDYLQSYLTDDSIANLGSIKEADMEALME